jgi:hypothetical protein
MEYSDKDILDKDMGGRSLREMTALDFMGWVASKMNGLSSYSAANQELSLFINNPPLGRLYPDGEKVRIVRKLLELDVKI